MRFPPPLRPGDRVGLAAPSSPVSTEERDQCIAVLESMGFRVAIGDVLKKPDNIHGYLAGNEKKRAEDLNRMFASHEVKAIFNIRGGYGSSMIMKYLDYDLIRRNSKIFIGYSDITNLHTAFQKYCGFVTFHGPMVKPNMLPNPDIYSIKSLMETIAMGDRLRFRNPDGETFEAFQEGRAKGIITGGNLAVLARSCGTFYQPDTAGKILFLEDIGESVPSLHMYLNQLEHAGLIDQAAGILLGEFTECDNERYDPGYCVDDFFREWSLRRRVPVMAHICSGHGSRIGTIPFGTNCMIDTKNRRILFEKQ